MQDENGQTPETIPQSELEPLGMGWVLLKNDPQPSDCIAVDSSAGVLVLSVFARVRNGGSVVCRPVKDTEIKTDFA